MRRYIFTKKEREALHQWLSGSLDRAESPLLHTTLGRLRRAEDSLLEDLRLLTFALRRLHHAPKLRRRKGDMDTSLAIFPIHIHIPDTERYTYVKLIRSFHEAQSIANEERALTETRLIALETAAKIGRILMGVAEDEADTLKNILEKLKLNTP